MRFYLAQPRKPLFKNIMAQPMSIYMAQPMKLLKWSWYNPWDFSKYISRFTQCFGKYRIKPALCKWPRLHQPNMHVVLVLPFKIHHSVTCQYLTVLTPCGCIFKRAGHSSEKCSFRISSLHSNMSACGTWRWWRLIDVLLPQWLFLNLLLS